MTQASNEREWYPSLYEEFKRSLNGQSETPLGDIRGKAIRWFSENGFPNKRQEEWRFTDISPIAGIQFKTVDETRVKHVPLDRLTPFIIQEDFPRLVFVNGCFDLDLSSTENLPKGLSVQPLKEAIDREKAVIEGHLAKHAKLDENGFVALNTAFIKDGAYIHVDKGAVIEQPVHILFVSNSTGDEFVTHPRNLIVVEDNAEFSFIESYVTLNTDAYFTNPVTEVSVGENSNVQHYKIQRESENAFHTALIQVQQLRSSAYASHNYSFGGRIARNDVNGLLDGEGIECFLNGLYLANGKQLIDNHSVLDHAKPHCHSNELYKGILDDQARAVFSGKIHVRPDAQKTDAIQSNQNLILSEDATVDTKPQLEIFADDVRCTHGGTVGQIDKDGVFYLRTRGISETTARHLMIQAFAGQVTDLIKHEAIRDYISQIVVDRLEGGHLQ